MKLSNSNTQNLHFPSQINLLCSITEPCQRPFDTIWHFRRYLKQKKFYWTKNTFKHFCEERFAHKIWKISRIFWHNVFFFRCQKTNTCQDFKITWLSSNRGSDQDKSSSVWNQVQVKNQITCLKSNDKHLQE